MTLRYASVFSQLLAIINRNAFARLVKETGAEKGTKGFASWDQLVAMMGGHSGSVLTIDTRSAVS